jgi:transposase-like protein
MGLAVATQDHSAQTGRSGARPYLVQKPKRNYLLKPEYREMSLMGIMAMTEPQARDYVAKIRWGQHGEGKQVCPECGSIETHYWCESVGRWKCREKTCGKQFTVFSGTRVHNLRMGVAKFLSILFHFVEAKDGMSSRELSGLHDLNHQTVHVLTLKIREAIRVSTLKEPMLEGYIHADAAYFMKYVRPGNTGTGAALAAKADQKNAGLDENSKVGNTVSEKMHALVVFVQAGKAGERAYRVAVIKTENQVDLLKLGQQFCTKNSLLVTDEHSAYNFYSGEFDAHYKVNHRQEFMNKDGFHTNYAESYFARVRAAVSGAWHKQTLQYLEEYAWEFAWRQFMVGTNNREQFEDLLKRVLNSGRAVRFGDYWKKRPGASEAPKQETGKAIEVDKDGVKKRRGRPSKGAVRAKPPEKPKRAYRKKDKPEPPQSAPPAA